MKKTLTTKNSNNRIVKLLMIMALGVLMMSGCSQVNDMVNGNKATNSNTATNSNASANTNANSNSAANSNANANTSVSQSNSATNTNNQANNTDTATKEEVPLTEKAKAFAFSLIGDWAFGGGARKVTFTEDKFEVKNGDNVIDKGSYRVLDEKTVEINSVQNNRKWNATMKIMDDGNKLDWQQSTSSGGIEKLELNRVKP